ncbi:MAG: DUF2914 domain-containing protein [Patescibacteria group bacterium]
MFENVKNFLTAHQRVASFSAIFLGFIVDSLTLPRVDVLWGNILLLFYIVVAATSIYFINLGYYARTKSAIQERMMPFLPFLIQFSFGALFSGYFIFYARSASLGASTIFLLMLVVLLFGNEFFKSRYQRLEFQTSILFLAIFFFAIFYTPIVMKEIGASVFILSGVVSLLIIGVFLFFVSRALGQAFWSIEKVIFRSILGVYLFLNILYFTNIIPPIPLSLKESGVYHNLVKTTDGTYLVLSPHHAWYDLKEIYYPVFKRYQGEPAYFFSAVFSPTDLNTKVLHEWQYFDEEKREWTTTDRLRMEIIGGREGGYRGYSMKQSLVPGNYRVNVVTLRGQILGRTNFSVINVAEKQNLEMRTLGE